MDSAAARPIFVLLYRERLQARALLSPLVADILHPAVAAWFGRAFAGPTPAQHDAWPQIQAGKNVLIAAPTGSGKTLAAFLMAIDDLVRRGIEAPLPDETQVVYVSPLKALSNDVQKNLAVPLDGIRATLAELGLPEIDIATWVRTGDTPASDRAKMHKRPPHIVVTTPESLYILLGSASGRAMLATTRQVIVDEIHAVAGNKRGSHLALSLERLQALCGGRLQRIGLSATQKPIEDVARFLIGAGAEPSACHIVDAGHARARDLALALPPSPLSAVMSGEIWTQVYDQLAGLVGAHRTTLIFVNTRRMVERVSRELAERIGAEHIAAHHGSLSKESRLDAEQRLKHGKLKVLVATASLELGIDIGEVDLVCQLGSPRSIASFLQRVGRSGHAVGATPKGRLFPLSRDELVECAALLDSVRRGELDRLVIPPQPLDVLAQHIAAETAAQDWSEGELFALVRRAWPYHDLPREDFAAVVRMLAEGFTTRRGRRGALIHHDAVNGMIRGRRGAQLTALTSGGAIPDNADYRVLLEPQNTFVGTLHEDFAVESLAGDIFQLGNQSYRILRVERGTVRVEDAQGQPPTMPFWLGEAPGRSDELSAAVSRLRAEIERRLQTGQSEGALGWLTDEVGIDAVSAKETTDYLAAGHAALGVLPTQRHVVFERFFDDSGGMQLVIHAPFGSRINRAWGLALRKRFCRTFNFELQAAATEDNIVLSLTGAHSFDLADIKRYLNSKTARDVLIQALLDAPMFATRWRWVASISLALPRFRGGKKRAPQLARMDAEDLLGSVFPDQVACAENLVGAREIPDHPLVRQTLDDCLHEAMDIDGLERLLRGLESGEIDVSARELTEPSLLAQEVLAARPYAYLDDAPLEERRTQAVMGRRWLSPEDAADIGRLDPEAVARVRSEAAPDPRNPDELHDALVWFGCVTEAEARAGEGWSDWLSALARDKRATRIEGPRASLWIAAERLPQFKALWPDAPLSPPVVAPAGVAADWTAESALVEIVRGRLEGQGPVTEAELAATLGLERAQLDGALLALQTEGFAMRGQYSPDATEPEWCDRRLVARMHRYTVKRLRAEIEPVAVRDYLRFLLSWQRATPDSRMEGSDAVPAIVEQLEGYEAPAGAWETEILPARLARYDRSWLDRHGTAGRIVWTRAAHSGDGTRPGPMSTTAIALIPRRHARLWQALTPGEAPAPTGARAKELLAFLRANGASFFDEMADGIGGPRYEVEGALAELAGLGLVSSDGFAGLRALIAGQKDARRPFDETGRWSLVPQRSGSSAASPEAIEHAARTLLRRYGVVFWTVLEREKSALPPWRDLLGVYRRLEARGEIRGGRFVAGFPGEQFALPEAIGLLREARRKPDTGTLACVSGADPLNLVGILTPGAKLPARTKNRLLYRDGLPIAWIAGGKVHFEDEVAEADRWQLRKMLLQGPRFKPTPPHLHVVHAAAE